MSFCDYGRQIRGVRVLILRMQFGNAMTKQSKYYPAAESWTKRPAWAFEIPLAQLDAMHERHVILRRQSGVGIESYHELNIPCAYLEQHLPQLFVRQDRNAISLFLSAEIDDRFTDRRGPGQVTFGQF